MRLRVNVDDDKIVPGLAPGATRPPARLDDAAGADGRARRLRFRPRRLVPADRRHRPRARHRASSRRPRSQSVAARIAGWRQRLSAHIRDRLGGGGEAGIAAALATGDQYGIPEADAEAMRRSGLAHLLSVSGLHLTAVVGAVMLLTLKLLALEPRAGAALPPGPDRRRRRRARRHRLHAC